MDYPQVLVLAFASIVALIDLAINEFCYRFVSQNTATRFIAVALLALSYVGVLFLTAMGRHADSVFLKVLFFAGVFLPPFHFITRYTRGRFVPPTAR